MGTRWISETRCCYVRARWVYGTFPFASKSECQEFPSHHPMTCWVITDSRLVGIDRLWLPFLDVPRNKFFFLFFSCTRECCHARHVVRPRPVPRQPALSPRSPMLTLVLLLTEVSFLSSLPLSAMASTSLFRPSTAIPEAIESRNCVQVAMVGWQRYAGH